MSFENHPEGTRDRIADLLRQLAEKDKEIERLRSGIEHIQEYWNQSDNDMAVVDALREIVETADELLKVKP